MRKFLLFALTIMFAYSLQAQNAVNLTHKANNLPPQEKVSVDTDMWYNVGPVNNSQSTKAAVGVQAIGSSGNIYTALVENQTALAIDEDANVITYTHRADPNVVGVSSGDIVVSHSSDGGMTWKTDWIVENTTLLNNRYPGGVVLNPNASTNPDDLYSVICGPSHEGGNWDNTFFASYKLDSTNIDVQYLPSYGALVRYGLVNTDNGVFVMGNAYTDSPYKMDTMYLYNGMFNSTNNNMDWTISKFTPSFIADTDGGDFAYAWYSNSAWSDDGQTGYMWTLGRDSDNDTRSYMPIVWKTVDGGANWAKMPVFDYSDITALTDELRPIDGTDTIRPMFSSALDGVVDANGDLHLMALVKSSSSSHVDSLGYSWYYSQLSPAPANPIFDVYTTSTGWDARLMGKVYTIDVSVDETPYGDQGWDLRIQAGRSVDGSKVFASWSDTDTLIAAATSSGLMMNSYPNIFVCGYDVNSSTEFFNENVTAGTSIDGAAYYHYMAEEIFEDGGEWNVPLSIIDISNGDPLMPVYHKYLTGVTTSIEDVTADNSVSSVSQNRPNPFNGTSQFDITLDESANITVNVLNMMGQVVSSTAYGELNAGVHTMTINANNLSSGIYFYSVIADGHIVTKKMIVE